MAVICLFYALLSKVFFLASLGSGQVAGFMEYITNLYYFRSIFNRLTNSVTEYFHGGVGSNKNGNF